MAEFINPYQILTQLPLDKNITAVDFGCGSGGWVVPLAQKLEKGRVFAVDIQEEPLSVLSGKAKSQGLSNIKTILADVEKGVPEIAGASCDLVLMTNLLFQVEDKEAVFEEAKRILKPEGKILVVDWKPETALGPKQGKVSTEEVKEIAESADLQLEREFEAGTYHYGLIFAKP